MDTKKDGVFETYFPLRDTAFGLVSIRNAFGRAGLALLNPGIAIGRAKDDHDFSFEAVNSFAEERVQEDEPVPEPSPEISLPVYL